MDRDTRLLRASFLGAAHAATAFALVIFAFLLCTPGDAGLSVGVIITILLFSVFGGIAAFIGYLPGVLTVGVGVYVILARFGLTGRAWAVGSGALLTGLPAWLSIGDYVTLTGTAIAGAMCIGGVVGALSFRRTVLTTNKAA